jgi:hypothetical protein
MTPWNPLEFDPGKELSGETPRSASTATRCIA